MESQDAVLPRAGVEGPVRHCALGAVRGDAVVGVWREYSDLHGLLGDADVRMTMISSHLVKRGGRGVPSPVDGLVDPDPAAR